MYYYINRTNVSKKTYLEAMSLKGGDLEKKVGKFVPYKTNWNGFWHGSTTYRWVRVAAVSSDGNKKEHMIFMNAGDGVSFDPSPKKNKVSAELISSAEKYGIERQKPSFGRVSYSPDFW